MKALTLTQPWATLVALGAKSIETRSWSTKHRGPIAIHAAKGFPNDAVRLCGSEPFDSVLRERRDTWPHGLPTGAIVAVATVLEVMLTGDWLNYRYQVRDVRLSGGRSFHVTPTEIAFGNYEPGRFAWLLTDVARLVEPIPAKGMLGLWTLDEDLERLVFEAEKARGGLPA